MKNKIFVGLGIIVVIGIIIVATLGFRVNTCYKGYNLVDIDISKDYNIADIKPIINEVFAGKDVEIQKAGAYSDGVAIKVDEVSDEQVTSLKDKINEKLGTKIETDNIEVNYISNYKLSDIAQLYVFPLILSTVIIFAYFGIKYNKLGAFKLIIKSGLVLVLVEAAYAALIAITRYPIDRLTMPVGIMIYLTVLTILNCSYNVQVNAEKNKKVENK